MYEGVDILAFVLRKCDKCNSDIKFNFTQRIDSYNDISWCGGYRCTKCDDGVEIDGSGIIDDTLRNIILEQEGLWGLHLEKEIDKVEVIKIIRKALNLSIEEVKRIKNSIPGVIITGTNVEMKRLQLLLKIGGLRSEVVKMN